VGKAPGSTKDAAQKPAPLRQVVVAPPRGGSPNLLSQGSPDAAGNTPVVQVPGPKPAVNGVQQAQPVANEAAPMPGGVSGGGRSQMPDTRQTYTKGGRASASVVRSVVASPVTWLVVVVLAVLGLVARSRARRRRPVHLRATTSVREDRPLVSAGKGDRS
jgi:hypothetical protein